MHSRTPSMTSINSAYAGAANAATYGTVPAGRGGLKGTSGDEGYHLPTIVRGQGHRSLQQKNLSSGDEHRRRSILPGNNPSSPINHRLSFIYADRAPGVLEDALFTSHVKSSSRTTISPQPSKSTLPPSRNSPRTKATFPRSGPANTNGPIIKTPKWAQSQFYDGDDDDSFQANGDSSNERVPLITAPSQIRDYSASFRNNNAGNRRFKSYKSRNRLTSSGKMPAMGGHGGSYDSPSRRRSARYYRGPSQAGRTGGESQCWPGLAGTAILIVTLLILTMLTLGFVFQTSRNLENVVIRNLTNIVVSEEELVMDVLVSAGNPNILPVVMGETINIDVFARSDQITDKDGGKVVFRISSDALNFEDDDNEQEPPVQDSDDREENNERMTDPEPIFLRRTRWPPWHRDDPDDPTKPPKNITEGTSLLLGTIHALEAPLSFPATSFRPGPSKTTQKGQMKLFGPAVNSTDGIEKWRKVISAEFELIVRGTMKYRAPIGGRERAVAVEWRGNVDPKGNRVWNGYDWVEGEV